MRTLGLLLLFGCRGAGDAAGKDTADAGDWTPPADDADADTDADADADADSGGPPEEEDDYLALAPAATSAYVFVANPTRDTVTRI
ncbi:MAG: hypothetical protein ACOZNI_13805, partial [Myxococcota bacterium]